MNVLIRNEYRVEIILSFRELQSYGITYEEIDYGNIETRRLLWSLQDEVQKKYGCSIKLSGRLLIEVIKDSENSVRICFSSLTAKAKDDSSVKQLIKSETAPVVAEFSELEEMLQAISLLTLSIKSSLYEKNGKYRILFYVSEAEKDELIYCLCEFSEILSNSAEETAKCTEMWNMVAAEKAVSCLHRLF